MDGYIDSKKETAPIRKPPLLHCVSDRKLCGVLNSGQVLTGTGIDLDLVAVSAVAAVAGAAGQAGQTSDATGESGVLEEVPPRNVAHSVSFPSCCFPHLRLMRKFTEHNV